MRRRGLIAILILALVSGSAALGWYGWRWYNAPQAPDIATADLDPELTAAIEKARQRIRQDPYSAPRWGDLGKLLRDAHLVPSAAGCYAQAERLDPRNPRWPYLQGEALRLRDSGAALPPLERAAALAGDREIAPHLRLAEVLLSLGREKEAEQHLRRAQELDPDDPTVEYNLGVLALARDDTDGALAHLKRSEHSLFTQRKTCIQLAAVYRRLGRDQEADKYSRKADQLEPDRTWLDPFLPTGEAVGRSARLQQVQRLETQGDFRAAAEQLALLIQERPEYSAYVALGSDLAKMGDFAGAEQAMRSAIALAPEGFKAHYELSRLFWVRADRDRGKDAERARKEYEESIASARRALACRPDHGMAHVVLGMSLRGLGKRDEAREAFRTAITCSPDLADAHLYLGELLAEEGRTAEARASLERAVQLARPEDSRPRDALARLRSGQ
jgi:tetratricopeptide (TPR) repeat protein